MARSHWVAANAGDPEIRAPAATSPRPALCVHGCAFMHSQVPGHPTGLPGARYVPARCLPASPVCAQIMFSSPTTQRAPPATQTVDWRRVNTCSPTLGAIERGGTCTSTSFRYGDAGLDDFAESHPPVGEPKPSRPRPHRFVESPVSDPANSRTEACECARKSSPIAAPSYSTTCG